MISEKVNSALGNLLRTIIAVFNTLITEPQKHHCNELALIKLLLTELTSLNDCTEAILADWVSCGGSVAEGIVRYLTH